jgi:hypothetical protein
LFLLILLTVPDPELKDPVRKNLYEEDFVVPFPYAWITVNDGSRVPHKYEGSDERTNRGEQGQPLSVGKKI